MKILIKSALLLLLVTALWWGRLYINRISSIFIRNLLHC